MEITRRSFLKKSLTDLTGLTFLILSGKINGKQQESKLTQEIEVMVQTRKENTAERQEVKSNYDLIRQHIYDFLKDYIEQVSKESEQFRRNKEKYAKEEGGFAAKYAEAHYNCLDSAKKTIEESREITDEEFSELGKKLCEMQKQYSSLHINYSDKKVIEAQTQWAIVRTKHFQKLLRAEKKFNNFGELVRKTYTEREYIDYIEKQNNASRKLYSSMESTMNFIVKLFGGSEEIEIIWKYTKKVYDDTIQQFFKTQESSDK